MMSSQVIVRPVAERAEEFVAAFNALASEVLTKEQGAIDYYLLRSRTDPAIYRVVERYIDDAAYEAHRQTDHYTSRIGHILAVLACPPVVEHFDTV